MLNLPYVPAFDDFNMYEPIVPAFYYDVYSAEERIHAIYKQLEDIVNYCGILADTNNDISDRFVEDFDNLKDDLQQKLDIMDSNFKAMLAELAEGMLEYDVTTGSMDTSKIANRNLFHMVAKDALTIDELNDSGLTVSTLASSGLTVQGVATMSDKLISKNYIPERYLA